MDRPRRAGCLGCSGWTSHSQGEETRSLPSVLALAALGVGAFAEGERATGHDCLAIFEATLDEEPPMVVSRDDCSSVRIFGVGRVTKRLYSHECKNGYWPRVTQNTEIRTSEGACLMHHMMGWKQFEASLTTTSTAHYSRCGSATVFAVSSTACCLAQRTTSRIQIPLITNPFAS